MKLIERKTLNALTRAGAVNMDLGTVNVRGGIRAQHVNDLRHFVGREHGGVDFARRDGVNAHAKRAEVGRHLAREGGERRFRRGVSGVE